MLYETLKDLVFDQYIRKKMVFLNQVLRRGVMMAGIDWANAPDPKGWTFHFLLLSPASIHSGC